MKELSLFTGAGGGLLGTKLLGWEHIGYVEYNEYCQKVIAQRIKDGFLDEAPIFGDIRAFLSEGYAESYQGMVDVITAGFPCQPFSVAGKQKGEDDERNMWPQTIDVIRRVRPQFTLLENVPGLLAHEYSSTIFRDLAESGYECRWRILSAAEVGAPHKRDRVFILCADAERQSRSPKQERQHERAKESNGCSERRMEPLTADTHSTELREKQEFDEWERKAKPSDNGEKESLADAKIEYSNGGNVDGKSSKSHSKQSGNSSCKGNAANSSVEGLERQQLQGRTGEEYPATRGSCWWTIEPNVGRVANGVAHRVDRLKALGNGQVPAVVRSAWMLLSEQ